MDTIGYIKPANLSIGLQKVWIVGEEFVDDRISSEFIHYFPEEISLNNGIVRNPKNGNFILNPKMEGETEDNSYEVSPDFTGLFKEKRDCQMTAAHLNEKELKRAEALVEEYFNKADTLQNTVMKFYKDLKKV